MEDTTVTVAGGEPAKLVFRNGRCRGKIVVLDRDRMTVGRNSRNDLVIDVGMIVSSFHAVLTRGDDGSWAIEDLRSKNGTYVNGERVTKVKLCEGDVISFALTGPEVHYTSKKPELPGILETTLTTYRRTNSLETALRELLPSRSSRSREAVSVNGRDGDARRLDELEKLTRRSRWIVVGSAASLMVVVAAVLVLAVFRDTLFSGPSGAFAPAASSTPAAALDVELIPDLEPIYGAQFLSYREKPIGKVQVVNRSEVPLDGLTLSFGFKKLQAVVDGFLVEPYLKALPTIEPGESVDVPLLPKLSTGVLSAETREVTVVLTLLKGKQELETLQRALFIHGRNVFNWENPERITAFIDPQDPALREFVAAIVRKLPPPSDGAFPPVRFQTAVSLLSGLSDLGLRYIPDARTPISSKVDWKAIDRVHYPWETLTSRTGDCDDLSVLCASVLESAQIPTALVVGAQHVLLMFDSGIETQYLDSTPIDPDTVVPWEGRVWVPIESTALGRQGASFETAWSSAWVRRDAIVTGEMQVIDVQEGWKKFSPMNPRPDDRTQGKIDREVWVHDGLSERVERSLAGLKDLFEANLDRKVRAIEFEQGSVRHRDWEVGRLLARSGLPERAAASFRQAIFGPGGSKTAARGREELLQALRELPPEDDEIPYLIIDLAICYSMAGSARQLDLAAACYQVALEKLPGGDEFPERGEHLLRLALVHRLKGDLVEERHFTELAYQSDPTLRDTYRSLIAGDGTRAGEESVVKRYLLAGLR